MDVKIVSSARPLHIQRSVEDNPAPDTQNDLSPAAPSMRKSEYYNEEIESHTNVSLSTMQQPSTGHVSQPDHMTQPGHLSQPGHVTQPGHGPLTVADLFNMCNVVYVTGFGLLVVLATLFCILTEDDISLAYVLPGLSFICIVLFYFLKL